MPASRCRRWPRVARWSRANGVAGNIEIKPSRGRERETGAAVALDARALWRGAAIAPLLSSFSEAALAAAREAVPELPRALLGREMFRDDWRERLARLGCIALDTRAHAAHAARIDGFHAAGLRLPRDRQRPARAAELVALGCRYADHRRGRLIPRTEARSAQYKSGSAMYSA